MPSRRLHLVGQWLGLIAVGRLPARAPRFDGVSALIFDRHAWDLDAAHDLHHASTDNLGNLRDYCVSEASQSVHPVGNPIASSTKRGDTVAGHSSESRKPSTILLPR